MTMRTRNLLTVAAALLLAGCSQNEITEMSPDANPAVGFNVYSGVQTKGTQTDVTALKTGFGVFAYHTNSQSWAAAASGADLTSCTTRRWKAPIVLRGRILP